MNKINHFNFSKIVNNVCEKDIPQIRKGQQLFNALYDEFPEIMNEIRGTENDCFYDDNKIEKMITYILDNF